MCDDNKESLDKEEGKLMEILKEACTPYGDERLSRVSGNYLTLLKCGYFYLKKANLSDGLQRKLCYIKAAEFLFAGKKRLEPISDPQAHTAASNSIRDLHRSLLSNIGSGLCDPKMSEILLEISDNVKTDLNQLRNLQYEEMTKTVAIGTQCSRKEAILLYEEKKIELVKHLLSRNSAKLKKLVYYIAGECEHILGKYPCEFALVGLGSLAKNEATLHSDIKYIIILPEGIKYLEKYHFMLDYFRWLAVLMQVIIIGVGESPISSVGIEYLDTPEINDKNWFVDNYTPSGLAIDGYMPLVYTIPHGKQIAIPVKSGRVEFIKPFDEMVSLLSYGESFEESFHMRNLLRHSTLIYGSDYLFRKFSSSVYDELSRQVDFSADISHLRASNTDDILKKSPLAAIGLAQFGSKSFFYRPLSLCLGYIGTFFRWNIPSGFDIISGLKNYVSALGVICDQYPKCHGIELAFAVACELRMKAYAIGQGSRQRKVQGDIFALTERRGLRIVIHQVWNLSKHLGEIWSYATSRSTTPLRFIYFPSLIDTERDPESTLQDQLDLLNKNENVSDIDRKYILHNCINVAWALMKEAAMKPGYGPFLIEKAKNYILRHPGYIENSIASGLVMSIFARQMNCCAAFRICEVHTRAWKNNPPKNALPIRIIHAFAMMTFVAKAEFEQYCDRMLSEIDDAAGKLAFEMARISSRGNNERDQQALKALCELAINEGVKQIPMQEILLFLDQLLLIQYKRRWIDDAILTVAAGYGILESKMDRVSLSDYPNLVGRTAARCYLDTIANISDPNRLRTTLIDVLNICKSAGFREECRDCYNDALRILWNGNMSRPTEIADMAIREFVTCIPEDMKSAPLPNYILRHYKARQIDEAQVAKNKKIQGNSPAGS